MARYVPYCNNMLTSRKPAASDEFDDERGSSSLGWPALSLIRIVWKRKVPVLLMWAVLSAAVVAVVMLWPATYRAETLILVDSQKIPEKYVSATVSMELQDRLATLSQGILSSTRLQKVIDTFHLYDNERKKHVPEELIEMMRSDIKITTEKGWIQNRPGAFRVSYEGRDPAIVAAVTNQLGNLFIDENLHSRETVAAGTLNFIKSQLEEAKKTLEQQETKLSQFKQSHNGELPQQENSLGQELSRMQVQLQGNQDALNRDSQNKMTLESSISVAQSTEATLKRLIETASKLNNRSVSSDGEVAAPKKKKSEQMEEDLAMMMTRYTPEHPEVRKLKAAIEQVKIQEAKEDNAALPKTHNPGSVKEDPPTGSPEAVRTLAAERERIALLNAQLAAVNSDIKNRQVEQKRILSQIESLQSRLGRLPIREQEMAAVTRDYELSKANYHSLQDKMFAADMASEMEHNQKSERFVVLDSARVPQKPISPDRPVFAGLGSTVALGLSLGFWLLIDIRKNKILGEWELPEGMLVLGRVPDLLVSQASSVRPLQRRALIASTSVLLFAVAGVAAYLKWLRD